MLALNNQPITARASDSVLRLTDCETSTFIGQLKTKRNELPRNIQKNSFRFGISIIQRTTLYVDKFNFETKLFSDTL